MRTTLTLDNDIAFRLAEIRAEGLAAIRAGERRKPVPAFSTKTYRSKCLLPESVASTHDMLAFAEGEDWKPQVRRP